MIWNLFMISDLEIRIFSRMDQDLEKLEEEVKREDRPAKKHKQSGRSVFKLQEIIKAKSKKNIDRENSKQDSIS